MNENDEKSMLIRKEEPESEDKNGKKQIEKIEKQKDWDYGIELFYTSKNSRSKLILYMKNR